MFRVYVQVGGIGLEVGQANTCGEYQIKRTRALDKFFGEA